MSRHPPNAKYPDAIALAFDERNNKLTCVYNDHSIYVWDVRDIRRVGKSHSFLYHSACIWGVEMYPAGPDSIGGMPAGSFVTCSSDDTIRVWNLDKDVSPNDTLYKRNIYSNVSTAIRAILSHDLILSYSLDCSFFFSLSLFCLSLLLNAFLSVFLCDDRNCSKSCTWIRN
jgi:WD40 repeat protein